MRDIREILRVWPETPDNLPFADGRAKDVTFGAISLLLETLETSSNDVILECGGCLVFPDIILRRFPTALIFSVNSGDLDNYLSYNWEWRESLVPINNFVNGAIKHIKSHDIVPGIAFLYGRGAPLHTCREILTEFPDAIIVGDNLSRYNMKSFAEQLDRDLTVRYDGWKLTKKIDATQRLHR